MRNLIRPTKSRNKLNIFLSSFILAGFFSAHPVHALNTCSNFFPKTQTFNSNSFFDLEASVRLLADMERCALSIENQILNMDKPSKAHEVYARILSLRLYELKTELLQIGEDISVGKPLSRSRSLQIVESITDLQSKLKPEQIASEV